VNQETCIDILYVSGWCRINKADEYIPDFKQGQTVPVKSVQMNEGKTSPPDYLTESELIGLMVNTNRSWRKKGLIRRSVLMLLCLYIQEHNGIGTGKLLPLSVYHLIYLANPAYRCFYINSHQQCLSKKLCTSQRIGSKNGSYQSWHCINPWVRTGIANIRKKSVI
jgi:hypothetical protein